MCFRPRERYWLLLEHREAETCETYPGLDEDIYITADAEAFVKWHAGQLSWEEATRDSRIYPGEYGATGEIEIRRVFEPEGYDASN
jgi:hypothetical protein